MSGWTQRSYLDDVLSLPDSPEKRDLEWCAVIAELASPIELRAINIATSIALRFLQREQKT